MPACAADAARLPATTDKPASMMKIASAAKASRRRRIDRRVNEAVFLIRSIVSRDGALGISPPNDDSSTTASPSNSSHHRADRITPPRLTGTMNLLVGKNSCISFSTGDDRAEAALPTTTSMLLRRTSLSNSGGIFLLGLAPHWSSRQKKPRAVNSLANCAA
jgi:hypothetical protein